MPDPRPPLAVITGASSGIGLELARTFVERGHDVVVAAEDDGIETVGAELRAGGREALAVQADLATAAGVDALIHAVEGLGRPVAALAINAGIGVGGPFIETPIDAHLRLISLNVSGAVYLTHRLVTPMAAAGEGSVLFTSSIAATTPGPYESTYAASKAFVLSFAQALRTELRSTGVTVTTLMPGPTDTAFFARAGIEDTRLGQSQKDDPAAVAREGVDALEAGKDHVITGSAKNTVQAVLAKLIPDRAASALHARMSAPGSGR